MNTHPLMKRRITYFLITSFFLISTILAVLFFLVICRIGTVNIQNCTYSSEQNVLDSSKAKVGMHIYAIDKEKMERKIKESNPYVSDVYITRTGLRTLNITLTEDKPNFYIEQNGKFIILSQTLRVLEIVSSRAEAVAKNAAQISLPPINDAVLREELSFKSDHTEYYDGECIGVLSAIADSSLSGKITYADLSEKFNIRVTYKDKYEIRLGSPKDIEEKLTLVSETITFLEDPINRFSTAKGIIHASVAGETSFEATGSISSSTP